MISFEVLEALWLLPLPLFVYKLAPSYLSRQQAIKVPFFNVLVNELGIKPQPGAQTARVIRPQKAIIAFGWLMLVLAAAKPVWMLDPQTYERSGRDLMLVVDLSGSMVTQDFTDEFGQPQTRLDSAKQVLKSFSQRREGDRLGLILFGDSAFLQSPFTLDHAAWLELLHQTEVAMAGESTSLGDAIGLGIKTFLEESGDSSNQEKVMIVLTDGNDTDSLVPPIDAAKVAAAKGIRVHMVAMGSLASSGDEAIDMDVINQAAALTGGEAFLAMSAESLNDIYVVLDELEPKLFESFTYQQSVSLHYIPVIAIFLLHLCFVIVMSIRRNRPKIGAQV
ncbi:VWA domain-containing protein [Vibrio maerlii]|uniref:VWA domain-containing protein n=1 Tax=Vibrio maerlii TaxID=2231648 RepID=UPI000E3CC988|nr:VWA domain-containing protein [Vibrio maerlii]